MLSTGKIISGPIVQVGLNRLRSETFREGALGFGAQEVVSTSVVHQACSSRSEDILRNGVWGYAEGFLNFSVQSMDYWLRDVQCESYERGAGTWTSCKVYLYPDRGGKLETFDIELIERDNQGNLTDHPADALTLFQDLKAFPRTVDNIPQWMWRVFRAEGVTPPVYNPELGTVDWANKRLPVTATGTDFSAEPEIIDTSKEPGVFAKMGKKLFGR
ncbi:hypothetical protein [Paenarthrobacter sp. NPDC057981]|uniref:hypothetical protein n=1 Tax=Paenarthrobacter sp. NPDC057981 TaxID=3346297 RepID=UPI0036DBE651